MTPEEVISKAAQESRADAGISQNTDQAAAFETGYELGWEQAIKSDLRVLALVEAIEFSICIAENGHIDEKFAAYAQKLLNNWRQGLG